MVPDALLYVIAAAGVAGGVWDLATARRWWNAPIAEEPPASLQWFPWWSHFRRTRLTGNLAIIAFFLGCGVVLATSDERGNRLPKAALSSVVAAIVLTFLLDMVVLFFNRPRFLVPPALRSEAGLEGPPERPRPLRRLRRDRTGRRTSE